MSAHASSSHIEISFEGKIHQVLISESGNQLMIHVNSSDKTTSFHLLDSKSLNTKKSWESNHDTPNLSVRAFDENKFVAISFSEIQNPDLLDVHVYEWENNDPALIFQNTKLLAANTKFIEIKHPMIENRTVQIDLLTGSTLISKKDIPLGQNTCEFPIAYEPNNEYFAWFEKLLKKMGFIPKMQCEHLEIQGSHLISFYIQVNDSLTNHLIYLDSEGNLKENYTLASDLKGIGKDTFFVHENKAIFVSNYNTLNVLHL